MTPSPRNALTNTRLLRLAIFGIAMGLLEAIVVVYLRELYFPQGFRFPLRAIPEQMLRLEVLRELCTVVMLLALALIATEGLVLRLAVFLFTFGIWDLCYYLFLKLLLHWPATLMTWDVLFLVPLAWLGPVLAPVICAITMIGLSLLWVHIHRRTGGVTIPKAAGLMMGTGAMLIFIAFIEDVLGIVIKGGFTTDLAGLAGNARFQATMAAFVPSRFDWLLFSLGELSVVAAGGVVYGKNRNEGGG